MSTRAKRAGPAWVKCRLFFYISNKRVFLKFQRPFPNLAQVLPPTFILYYDDFCFLGITILGYILIHCKISTLSKQQDTFPNGLLYFASGIWPLKESEKHPVHLFDLKFPSTVEQVEKELSVSIRNRLTYNPVKGVKDQHEFAVKEHKFYKIKLPN